MAEAPKPDAALLESLVSYCRAYLGDTSDWKVMAGYPDSLALCVIDSIQSTGPHYTSVMNVVSRYRGYRLGQGANADTDGPHALIATFGELDGPEGWANTIGNHNRTYASKQAPFKSVAIFQAAQRLADADIDSPTHLRTLATADPGRFDDLHRGWLSVVSQSSGITWEYLLMLAGIAGVKPDRMVVRFVSTALGLAETQVSPSAAASLVRAAADEFAVSATTLDHTIWRYQSGRDDTSTD